MERLSALFRAEGESLFEKYARMKVVGARGYSTWSLERIELGDGGPRFQDATPSI